MVQGKDIKACTVATGRWGIRTIFQIRVPIILMPHILNTVTNKAFLQDTQLGRPWAVILCHKWRREKASMLGSTSHHTIEATIPCTAICLQVHIRATFLLHQPRPCHLASQKDPRHRRTIRECIRRPACNHGL